LQSQIHIAAYDGTSAKGVWAVQNCQSVLIAIARGIKAAKSFHQPPAIVRPSSAVGRQRDINLLPTILTHTADANTGSWVRFGSIVM
jgi:hypothetical protein